jgi:hypothetical protein
VTVWFTVKLDDRPGSLARVAAALGERGVNITGIVGVAEDTDGALMLTTSDPAATREVFASLALPFEEHDPTGGMEPDALSVNDLRPGADGLAARGREVGQLRTERNRVTFAVVRVARARVTGLPGTADALLGRCECPVPALLDVRRGVRRVRGRGGEANPQQGGEGRQHGREDFRSASAGSPTLVVPG